MTEVSAAMIDGFGSASRSLPAQSLWDTLIEMSCGDNVDGFDDRFGEWNSLELKSRVKAKRFLEVNLVIGDWDSLCDRAVVGNASE